MNTAAIMDAPPKTLTLEQNLNDITNWFVSPNFSHRNYKYIRQCDILDN
jgi:hypothetical protein